MSKERLEEIKKSYNFWMEEDESIGLLPEDIEWLIEQAERVQELEVQNQGLHIMYDVRLAKFDKLDAQNKSYREALEKIKDKNRFGKTAEEMLCIKEHIARKALEGEER